MRPSHLWLLACGACEHIRAVADVATVSSALECCTLSEAHVFFNHAVACLAWAACFTPMLCCRLAASGVGDPLGSAPGSVGSPPIPGTGVRMVSGGGGGHAAPAVPGRAEQGSGAGAGAGAGATIGAGIRALKLEVPRACLRLRCLPLHIARRTVMRRTLFVVRGCLLNRRHWSRRRKPGRGGRRCIGLRGCRVRPPPPLYPHPILL